MNYKVGSLSALLKGSPEDATSGDDSKLELKSLFKSRTTLEKPRLQQQVEEEQEDSTYKIDSSEGKAKKKVAKKEKKSLGDGGTDEDMEGGGFKTPSRSFLVKAESNKEKKFDPEKETRTVFVGNLPSNVNVKDIKRKFKEFGAVETIRLRGAARPDLKTTKKVAVITRKINENRNNINAYVRFKERESALKSCQLNGTEFDAHVIRVDIAMKTGAGKTGQAGAEGSAKETNSSVQHDQSKSIFLGNLNFGVQEDQVRKHFQMCGEIVDVRLIRDSFTGIGKGFGYVNFKSTDSIELGLKLNGTQLEGRYIRVTRSTNKPKQKMVQTVKPKIKPTFKSANQTNNKSAQKPTTKGGGGQVKSGKKFIKKPKVEFQGKVSMTTKEARDKKKAAKKAKRAESRKLKAQKK